MGKSYEKLHTVLTFFTAVTVTWWFEVTTSEKHYTSNENNLKRMLISKHCTLQSYSY